MLAPTRLMPLITPFALAACGQADEIGSDESEMGSGPEMSDDMDMPSNDETGRMASAEGTVTAIDDEAGTITIDHGPVPDVGWPAMTMAFAATEEQLSSVSVGDNVRFQFEQSEEGSKISAIATR